MTAILGIHDGHNAAAALLMDGGVVAAVQEERIKRIKNQGDIPEQSINEMLEHLNGNLSAVKVALNGMYITYNQWQRQAVLSSYEGAATLLERIKQPLKGSWVDNYYQRSRAGHRVQEHCKAGFKREQMIPVDHHLAHASAAYYGSGWLKGKVLVLTCDGSGDRLSATVNIGENGRIERVAEISEHDSIGRLYAMVTYYLGMVPLEHEYKVMGLAPYVNDTGKVRQYAQVFADLFEFSDNPLVWHRRNKVPSMYAAYGFLRKLLYRERFDVIAAGVQRFIEDVLTQWIRNCVRETDIHRVVCSGGVFMNVKANLAILSLPEIEELFVFPSCGDESNSIGAAYWAFMQEQMSTSNPVTVKPLGPLYYGKDINDAGSEDAIRQVCMKGSVRYKYVKDIEQLVAETIVKGEVVARAKGRMEFGARALGNRSILARPDNPHVVRLINDMIKNRDFWMPFAPSVLAERAEEYYVKPKPMAAPYMIIAFDSRPDTRQKYPAAQHPYDYTTRPHEVFADHNPDYYRLLKYYEDLTGEGIILNTSFNLHGDPIVYTASDALNVFCHSGLRYLALGNWWVWKE